MLFAFPGVVWDFSWPETRSIFINAPRPLAEQGAFSLARVHSCYGSSTWFITSFRYSVLWLVLLSVYICLGLRDTPTSPFVSVSLFPLHVQFLLYTGCHCVPGSVNGCCYFTVNCSFWHYNVFFFFFLIYAIYGSEIKTKSPAFLHSYLSVYLFYISLLFTFVNLFLLGILRLKYHGRFCFASQSGNLFSFYKLVKCIAFIDITNEFGFSSVYCTSHTRHMHVIITHILTATSLCVRFTTWSALFSLFLDMFWKLGRFVFLF